MRIVGIGGGTGLPVLLTGLKELSEADDQLDITAIVNVTDSGGSTGVLREAFEMPAMGDVRKCIVALAPAGSVLTSVCRHRFENPDGLAGHSFGNLFLSALYQMSGSFTWAVRQACRLLQLNGRVLPATERPVTLCAGYEDGGIARGESNIPQIGRRIQRVWLDPASPPAASGVFDAIEQADAIVFGPGSLYTSIIPNLLVANVLEAVYKSNAVKIYVINLMTQPGETDGYSAADHLRAMLEYTPIDLCVLNSARVGMKVAQRYLKFGSAIVPGTPEDEDEIRRSGVVPIMSSLLNDGGVKARHDPTSLANLVVSLSHGFAGVAQIACMQGNGRKYVRNCRIYR